ncbi:hypothetical protein [Promineifilum sp.]|uniref:hypothetical protein n=1 Tax=Promineifilum sp. TaxID=2664178 RepID=UPI0035B2E3AB
MTRLPKNERFNFRLDSDDRRRLRLVARRARRSQAETLRRLIRMAAEETAPPWRRP